METYCALVPSPLAVSVSTFICALLHVALGCLLVNGLVASYFSDWDRA